MTLNRSLTISLSQLETHLPKTRNDPRIIHDSKEKIKRLREWFKNNDYDAILISRVDNFAWLTVGGDNHVLKNTEIGTGHLLITPDKQFVLAYPMDGERLQEMELDDQEYELKVLSWYQGDPRKLAFDLVEGTIAADTAFPDVTDESVAIDQLHEPLTELEICRCRWLGMQTALLLEEISDWIKPGMCEYDVARYIRNLFLDHRIELDVMLVGTDERISHFYHCMPSNKKIEKYVQMNPSARRWGLHANINRCISFGAPADELIKDYKTALNIEGRVLSSLKPGLNYSKILELQKEWYKDLGYLGEWKNHFQGGPTGYRVSDAYRCFSDQKIQTDQVFDWFQTVHGLQVEELSLLSNQGLEILSLGVDWPLETISWEEERIDLPTIWIK